MSEPNADSVGHACEVRRSYLHYLGYPDDGHDWRPGAGHVDERTDLLVVSTYVCAKCGQLRDVPQTNRSEDDNG